ncbi:UNVERIFIED_CONTAM: hypothetical protein Sindi_0480900 [Sesamum indicum]
MDGGGDGGAASPAGAGGTADDGEPTGGGLTSGDRLEAGKIQLRRECEESGFEKSPVNSANLETEDEQTSMGGRSTLPTRKGGILAGKSTNNQAPPDLGFSAMEDETSGSLETIDTDTFLVNRSGLDTMTMRGRISNDQDEKSAADNMSFNAPQKLGFGEASAPSINGGRTATPSPRDFNITEFLNLANRIVDVGDTDSIEALAKLKARWEAKFGHGENLRQQTGTGNTLTFGRLPLRARRGTMVERALAHGIAPPVPYKKSETVLGKKTPCLVATPVMQLTPATLDAAQIQATATDRRRTAGTAATVFPAKKQQQVEEGDDMCDDVSADMCDDAADDVEADAGADLYDDVGDDTGADAVADVLHDISNTMEKSGPLPTQVRSFPTGLFVGNIPLNANFNVNVDDKIADAFNNSSRRTLSYIPPTIQNGEVVVRPTMETIRNGSTKWKTTAIGYLLGRRPYFYHVKDFAFSVWPGLQEVKATSNGFFFFQFKTVAYMEEAIEGGPWLFQGQPIVLQKWEPGMAMRKLKHTQVPVWIKMRHLPVELWTEEGLSTVASGIGKPLYPDAITRACTRLDFARVCVMLDVSSNLPKHIIIMTPDEEGGETPCKIDVEYEWLPAKCTSCMTLGHSAKDCVLNKPSKPIKPPVAVYVPKKGPAEPTMVHDQEITPPPRGVEKQRDGRESPRRGGMRTNRAENGKEIVVYNTFDALHLIDDADDIARAIWNVCGLNKRDHQLAVQDIVAEFRLQLLGLLETRVRINNAAAIQSFLLPNWKWFVDYGMVGNRIWIAWDDNFIDVDVVECGTQFIHCLVYIRSIRESIAITMIYGATEVADRRELWGSLETIAMQTGDIPWLIGGDFNAVRDISEICGASGDVRMAMEEFNDCIQNAGLLPLPMQGEWYTWHNCSASPRNLWKRWMARFPTSFYTSLTPRTSDHSPLVLYGDSQQQYGGMFRFDNYLTLSPEFIPSVQQVWQHNIIGAPMYAVTRKLKALKQVFREQRRNKGDLSHNVQLAKGFLEMAQLLVSSNRHDELLLQLEHCCRFILAKAAKLEQSMLQQRAKMQWMKGGDQCSRVFFRKIAQRRSARRILQINDDHGATHTEPQEVVNEFVMYYQNLLGGEQRKDVIDLRFLRPWVRHLLSEEDVNSLLLPFTPADVKQAVFDIAEDKAPGPDGYSSGFFKAAWPIVGQEVTSAVLDFFNTGRLLKQINTTLLALIPKVHTPMTVGDFRPISCCNVLYKIIAKLLVQRLSVILDKIISPCQAAFVPGRNIGDNIMLAQELFTGYNQARLPPRCALKVDIRKAYDTVEWDFMIAVMELFGFPPYFVKWIEMCVTTTSFSVGLNGKPHGFFKGARGLRQGDPLSPYLFVLVMEVLHLSFLQLIDQDELFSFHWKCDSARVFQLGFADDLLLFCHADMDSIGVFKTGLDRFAVWSGLRLNMQKSHLIISRSAQGLRDEMLTALGFQEGVLPMRYLGLPLLSSRLTIADCRPLLMKIDKRIAGWEGIALSYAGRVQIIKSVLMALSLYWASAFILPKKVTNEIEKRLRTFLWKGTSTSGYAKVAWKDLCRPKEEGGLGFKDITLLNRALMAKKLCDIIRCDRTSIWVTWLYQGRLRDTSIWTISEQGGSWGWRKLLRLRIFLRSMVDYKIGDGRRFYLWQDPWHHLGPLRDTFPRGPRLLRLEESTKLCTVISGGEWQWPPITDFECLEITHTLPTIYGGEDHIIWRFDHGIPTTQTLYRLFDPPGPKVDWYSLLSGSLKIPRHLFILWLAILGKLATTDKPWLVHLGPCILCNDGATETHDHLFFQCRFSRRCITEIQKIIRFSWPNRDWMTDIIWASRRWRGQHIINMSYRALLASCVYHIWKERNLRRFEQTERTPSTMAVVIIEDIKQRIHSITLPSSVSTRSLFRLWRIPWPVEGDTN